MLEPVKQTGVDVMIDAFLEQDTVYGLLDTYKIVEGTYLSYRVFAAFEGPYAVIEVFTRRYQERKYPGCQGRHRKLEGVA